MHRLDSRFYFWPKAVFVIANEISNQVSCVLGGIKKSCFGKVGEGSWLPGGWFFENTSWLSGI